MDRLNERLAVARQALATLDELAGKTAPSKVERDAAIQRFEYTFEATWKTAQLYLREEAGVDVASPKPVARASWEAGVLSEEDGLVAIAMVDDRNMTTHTYNERVAVAIFEKLDAYAALMRRWLDAIAARTASPSQ